MNESIQVNQLSNILIFEALLVLDLKLKAFSKSKSEPLLFLIYSLNRVLILTRLCLYYKF